MKTIRFNSIADIVSFDDSIKYEEYDQFLKCSQCTYLMNTPFYCPCCQRIFCKACTPPCAVNSAIPAQHLVNSMNLIEVSCKSITTGCSFHGSLTSLLEHAVVCSFSTYTNNDGRSSFVYREWDNQIKDLENAMDDQLRKKAKEVPAVKTPSTVEESKESVEMFYRVKLEAVKQNYIDYLESNFANKAKMLETALSQHLTKFEQQLIDMNQHQVDANKQEDEREVLKLEKEVEALTKKKNELLAKVSIRQAELKAKKENASKQIDELLLKHKVERLSNVVECNYYYELLFNKSKIDKSVVTLCIS